MITVVCTGGEAPPLRLCRPWLEAATQVIAVDGGLALVRSLGRKADLWIGDGDSVTGTDWEVHARSHQRLSTDKDDTDTEAALKAVQGGEVWLVGGAGGRMDHWWSNLKAVTADPRVSRWLTAHETLWRLTPTQPVTVEPGIVSVFGIGSGPWQLASEGLRWPLEPVDFGRWHSQSNEALATGGHLRSLAGEALVLVPHRGTQP